MAVKGQGARAKDLPGLTVEQLLDVRSWLEARRHSFAKGVIAATAEYRVTRSEASHKHMTYFKNAASAARWIIQQLDYVLQGRSHVRPTPAPSVGRTTGKRSGRPRGAAAEPGT